MKSSMKLQLKASNQLVMTPQLRQAIKLLQLPRIELEQYIQNALVENPVLEEQTEGEDAYHEPESSELDVADQPESDVDSQENIEDFTSEQEVDHTPDVGEFDNFDFQSHNNTSHNDNENRNVLEEVAAKSETLADSLLWQLSISQHTESEKELIAFLIHNLNENGYLITNLRELLASDKEIYNLTKEIAKKQTIPTDGMENSNFDLCYASASKKPKISLFTDFLSEKETVQTNLWTEPEKIEDLYCYILELALKKLHSFEPTGVGARSLQECLLLQGQEIDPNSLACKILKDYFSLLVNKQLKKISYKTGASLSEVTIAYNLIRTFNPALGRAFDKSKVETLIPDVFIIKRGSKYIIKLNDNLPKFRVNPMYFNIASSFNPKKIHSEKQKLTQEYLIEKIRAGNWLLKSIDQRQQTIYKVTESILKQQRPFFDRGVEYLKPMILKDIADDINMHESTVSRISNQKYVHTPQGIFELKFFFTSGLKQNNGEIISSQKIKTYIKTIISNEDRQKPHTDDYITKKLQETFDIKVARRTVAKYRESLNLPSSNTRKRIC